MVAPETGRLLISTSDPDSQRGLSVFPTAGGLFRAHTSEYQQDLKDFYSEHENKWMLLFRKMVVQCST